MNFLDENGLGRLWAQIILKLNSKVPDGGTTGQVLKKTETGTEWANESADAVQTNLDTHVNNTNIHVTAEEKSAWNAKLDSYTETDPTVPAWAKAASKPTYTASEVGADVSGSAASVQSNLDTHVNNTNIHVTAEEKSAWNAKLDSYTETDPTVPNWAKQPNKPDYTANEVGADVSGAADAVQSNLDTHVNNTTIHITSDERAIWNAKADASFKPAGKSYLTFSSPNSFTLKVNDTTKHWDGTLEYFTADRTWTTWDGATTLSSVDNDGENVLYLRGTGNTVITGDSSNYRWVLTGSDIACIGNIENLLDYATVASGSHPTMTNYCYANMFYGCSSLTQAPTLPATTLESGCYYYMFANCTGLTKTSALPATTLASGCYYGMFYYCTNLTKAPALPATTLVGNCYTSMFEGCTSLTQASALPATTLASACYSNMFGGCTSITKLPALPATTLANYCYANMFNGCSGLKLSSTQTVEYTQEYRIPASGTGTTASNALTNMFASTGGTFTGTPEINTTYYLSSDNMIVRETEIATLNGYVGSIAAPASHVSDTTVHVTVDEKSAWNESILIGESLIELPNPHSKSLDVTYGDNKFVAVMYSSNKAIYSLDGFTWHETTLPGSLQWNAVTYGNGKFVAIAANSTIAAYSADGITWNQVSLPSGGYWWDVTYGNGKFVTIKANSNTAAYSNDGITWTEITLPVSKFWYTITYGNNRFVVLPDGSNVAIYSDDGITWTETTLPVSKSWSGVSYGEDKFVAVATNSNIAIYSSDGVTWTETTLPVSNYWEPIIYGGDKFVATAFNNDGNIAIYSYNGIEWSDTTMPAVQNWKSLAYGQNKFVALSDTTMAAYSLDGITWSNTKPSLQTVSGTDVTDDTKVILGLDKPITPESIGAATMTEVNTAIQTAIGNAIGGSY